MEFDVDKELQEAEQTYLADAAAGKKLLEKACIHNKRRINQEQDPVMQKIYKLREMKVQFNCEFNVEQKRSFSEYKRLRDQALEAEKLCDALMVDAFGVLPGDQRLDLAGDCYVACGDMMYNIVEAAITLKDQLQFQIWAHKVMEHGDRAPETIKRYAYLQILIWRASMIGNLAMLDAAEEADKYMAVYDLHPETTMYYIRQATADEEILANVQYSLDAAAYTVDNLYHPEREQEIFASKSRLSKSILRYLDERIRYARTLS